MSASTYCQVASSKWPLHLILVALLNISGLLLTWGWTATQTVFCVNEPRLAAVLLHRCAICRSPLTFIYQCFTHSLVHSECWSVVYAWWIFQREQMLQNDSISSQLVLTLIFKAVQSQHAPFHHWPDCWVDNCSQRQKGSGGRIEVAS